jgi:uncharacterized Zn finger protein (UPF0148 family)
VFSVIYHMIFQSSQSYHGPTESLISPFSRFRLTVSSLPVECPKCGEEVEFLYRKKGHLYCPRCDRRVLRKELPPDAVFDVRPHPEEATGTESTAVVEEEGGEERAERSATRRKPTPLFEEPRDPVEIIAEMLLDWGCDEDFVRRVTEYINAKGVVDLGWLMTMLTSARTGRKFTPQEAFMLVDMIGAALERERRKAEELGRVFPLGVIPLSRPGTSPAPVYAGGYYSAQPSYYTPAYAPYAPAHAPSQSYATSTPPSAHSSAPQPQSTALTPQAVEEIVKRVIADQKKADVIDELKRMIYELEKKRVEDKAEVEKKIAESTKAVEERVTQRLESVLKEIRDAISSLQSQQLQTQQVGAGVDRKDLELIKAELEKAYLSRISELERKLLEAKSEAEKKEILTQLQELRSRVESIEKTRSRPVSPEGWQSDEARLVAELGTRFLDIIKERKPVEYIVKIAPKMIEGVAEKREKTEKSLAELIREAGGEVEE